MATANPFAVALESFVSDVKRNEDIRSPLYKEVLAQINNNSGQNFMDQSKESERQLAQFIEELNVKQKRSSKTIKIADKLRPLMTGLAQYTSACDVMIQAAPSAAVLLYGGARVVLLLAEKFYNCFDNVLSMMERIGKLLSCYHVFAKAYQASADMQRLLVETYKNIVSFWQKASKLFSRKAYKTLLTLIVKPLDSEWQRCRQVLEEDAKHVQMFAQATEADLQRKKEEQEAAHQQKKLRSEIISWIKGGQDEDKLDVRRDVRDHLETRHEDSCDWLFQHPEMEKWLAAKKSTAAWYSAGPGAGKTITASVLVRKLQEESKETGKENWRTVTFFCAFNDLVRSKPITVFRSLALQLLGPKDPIPEKVKRLFEDDLANHRSKLQDFKHTVEIVEALIKQQSRLHIIVDGLDECNVRSALLVSLCHMMHAKFYGIVKWFFSSRPDADIRTMMLKHGVTEMEAPQTSLKGDIKKFLTGRLHCEECEDHWVELSDGNFMWMVHMLPVIEGETSTCAEDIEEELEKFPKGLTGCYSRSLAALSKRPEKHQELARNIFAMVVGAGQPLRLSELTHALAATKSMVDYSDARLPRKELIEELCSNLVVFDRREKGTEDDPLVKLAHKSIQDFFLQDPDTLELPDDSMRQYFVTTESADLALGRSALNYLSYLRYNQPQDVSKAIASGDHAFLRHAAVFWHRYLSTKQPSKELYDKVLDFVRSEAFWTCVAVQSRIAPYLFATYTSSKFAGSQGILYGVSTTGHHADDGTVEVNYALPLPDLLESETHGSEGPQILQAFYSFVAEWHPLLNSHPAATDQCAMDFEWQMKLPGRIPWHSKRVRLLNVSDVSTGDKASFMSIAALKMEPQGLRILALGRRPEPSDWCLKWNPFDPGRDHSPLNAEPQDSPVLARCRPQTRFLSVDSDLSKGYWLLKSDRPEVDFYQSNGLGESGPVESHNFDKGTEWLLLNTTVVESSFNSSPDQALGIFHYVREHSGSGSDTGSAYDSGYGSMTHSDGDSDSDSDDSDSGISVESEDVQQNLQHCLLVIRANGPAKPHFWNSSAANLDVPCVFHPTQPMAIWSSSPHELSLLNLSSNMITSMILPEPVDRHFLALRVVRKEFRFSGSDTLHYLLYSAEVTKTGTKHTVSLSTFLFTPSEGDDWVLETTQATETVSYESASGVQTPLVLTHWTEDFVYIAFPPLSCNPKLARLRLSRGEDDEGATQTLKDPIYFPSSAPYRNPRLEVFPHPGKPKRQVVTLALDAELVKPSDASKDVEMQKPPTVMTWELKAKKDWRHWDEVVDARDETVKDNECTYAMLRGSFVDAERRFQVQVRSGLDWRKKAFLSCA